VLAVSCHVWNDYIVLVTSRTHWKGEGLEKMVVLTAGVKIGVEADICCKSCSLCPVRWDSMAYVRLYKDLRIEYFYRLEHRITQQ